VGDSRAYLISRRYHAISQITTDHSLVEELVEYGAITKEEARVHPKKNIITRAIGTEPEVEPDYFEFTLQTSDVLLMCSDGLSNTITDEELLDYTAQYADPEQLCRALMSKALSLGAKDNVTVVAVYR
jgi:protein phosphatase